MRRRLAAVLTVTALAVATPALAASQPTVAYKPVPNPHIPHYDVSGKFPVITGGGEAKANATLRKAFDAWSAAYKKSALKIEKTDPVTDHGIFAVEGGITAANRTYVSVILSTARLYPGGNDGSGYFSVTALPTGKRVTIKQVVSNFQDLTAKVRSQILATDACIADAQQQGFSFYDFKADPADYSEFAILKSGLYIGTAQGRYAEEACNVAHATLSWSSIKDDLTPLGKKLAAASTGGKHQGKMYSNA